MLLAQGLEARGNLRCEFLYDAEKVMRKTIERLRPAEFAPASQHQSEALALLIKAREAIRAAFGRSPPSEAVRRFDREQAQKLRKPKDQNEQAEMLAGRLHQLAQEEEFVYATLGGLPCEQGSPTNTAAQAQNAASSSPSPQTSPQSPEGDPKSPANQQPNRQGAPKQSEQGQPQQGEKGQRKIGAEGQQVAGGPSRQTNTTPPNGGEQARDGRQAPAGHSRTGEAGADRPIDRQQLEQRQRDVVLDAYEAERLLQGLNGMTELARNRMRRGTQDAEDASGALARGDRDAAREATAKAGAHFRELARHVEGLTAGDLAGKIGISRDLAAELAERQRGWANRLDPGTSPGAPTPDTAQGDGPRKRGKDRPSQTIVSGDGNSAAFGKGPSQLASVSSVPSVPPIPSVRHERSLSDATSRLAEGSRTLQDLLGAVAGDADADGELAAKIAAARKQARLGALIQQLDAIHQHPLGQQLAEFQAEARERADRLELLAQELGALHGTIVAPRLSELIGLEKQAARLQDQLQKLASDAEISQWHLEAQELLQALDNASSGSAAAETLRQAMTAAGWGTSRTGWAWARVLSPLGGHYYHVAPAVYRDNLTLLVAALQREARELLLRDLMAAGQEPVPPQYEKLVERYFEILSQEKKRE